MKGKEWKRRKVGEEENEKLQGEMDDKRQDKGLGKEKKEKQRKKTKKADKGIPKED